MEQKKTYIKPAVSIIRLDHEIATTIGIGSGDADDSEVLGKESTFWDDEEFDDEEDEE